MSAPGRRRARTPAAYGRRMTLDLDAYFARIGWTGEPRPTLEVLRSVLRAHLLGIPFENLDPVLGSAPSLALDDLEAKLVRGLSAAGTATSTTPSSPPYCGRSASP